MRYWNDRRFTPALFRVSGHPRGRPPSDGAGRKRCPDQVRASLERDASADVGILADATRRGAVMDLPFGGGCACGAIRYECAGAPRYMGNCHCTGLPAGGRRRLSAGRDGERERILPAQWRADLVRKTLGQGTPHAPRLLPRMRLAAVPGQRSEHGGSGALCGQPGRPELVPAEPGDLCGERAALESLFTRTSPRTRACRGDSRPICR